MAFLLILFRKKQDFHSFLPPRIEEGYLICMSISFAKNQYPPIFLALFESPLVMLLFLDTFFALSTGLSIVLVSSGLWEELLWLLPLSSNFL
jgi:hypothetical protein